jgi:hypothetical protein
LCYSYFVLLNCGLRGKIRTCVVRFSTLTPNQVGDQTAPHVDILFIYLYFYTNLIELLYVANGN